MHTRVILNTLQAIHGQKLLVVVVNTLPLQAAGVQVHGLHGACATAKPHNTCSLQVIAASSAAETCRGCRRRSTMDVVLCCQQRTCSRDCLLTRHGCHLNEVEARCCLSRSPPLLSMRSLTVIQFQLDRKMCSSGRVLQNTVLIAESLRVACRVEMRQLVDPSTATPLNDANYPLPLKSMT